MCGKKHVKSFDNKLVSAGLLLGAGRDSRFFIYYFFDLGLIMHMVLISLIRMA